MRSSRRLPFDRGTLASGPPWTPAALSSLKSWYKSDVGITIGTGVSQWADQSGNGNHLVQAIGVSQPVVTAAAINGFPAITFDGVNDYMQAIYAQGQSETIYMVFSQPTWTNNDFVFDGVVDLSRRLVQAATTPGLIASADTNLAQNNGLPVATFGLITFIVNGASSVFQVNNLAETTGNAGADVGNGMTLGCRGTLGSAFANISVAELATQAAVGSTLERNNFKSYVQRRYGIS